MLERPAPPPLPPPSASESEDEAEGAPATEKPARSVTARHPHDVWHLDISLVPIVGLPLPWLPVSLPTRWPFCWHVAAVVDHFSRDVVGRMVFRKEPTAADICALLDSAALQAGRAPRHIISDKGTQFTSEEYRNWCRRHGARLRFGAVGKSGSIAIIERFWRSMKQECFRQILVPFRLDRMLAELDAYVLWYRVHRPHTGLHGATPAEVIDGVVPACQRPAIEPRARYPLVRGHSEARLKRRARGRLELVVMHVEGKRHLPVVELREAA